MKVILKQDIASLGKVGDIVTVSDGHARNYLFPRGLAMEATESNLKTLTDMKKRQERAQEKYHKQAEELIKRLSGIICEIRHPAGEQHKLFGSVGAKDIQEALKAQGYVVDRKAIMLEENIQTPREYPVKIKLGPGLSAEIKVNVIPVES